MGPKGWQTSAQQLTTFKTVEDPAMQLKLKLTYPQERTLVVPLSGDSIEVVDKQRASCSDGDILIENAFGQDNIVPDVDRYRIRCDGERVILHPHEECLVNPCSNRYNDIPAAEPQRDCDRTLVIVLESPHKGEYLRNVGQPIAPAHGTTGRNLCRYLDEVLRSCPGLHRCIRTGNSRVILCNPVQFQASLASVLRPKKQLEGETNEEAKKRVKKSQKAVRDAVWKKLWNYKTDDGSFPIRNCFKNRLSTYRPDYIINACTSSDGMKQMKPQVSQFLRCRFPNCQVYEANHPSFWFNPMYRTLSLPN